MSGSGQAALRRWLGPLLRRASDAYVAGGRIDDASSACRALAAGGIGSTVCYWNADEEDAARVARAYEAIVDALAGGRLDARIAVKPWALASEPGLLAAVLERAREAGVPVQFDSLDLERAGATLALAGELSSLGGSLGVTIPGRWRRSPGDAEFAADRGLRVRVVKGQWPDPERPNGDLRRGFLEVVERLAGRATRVLVATHDGRLARLALSRLRAAGTPCELELLYGLPVAAPLRIARLSRVPVRMYVPYGQPTPPYVLTRRSVRRDPRMLAWLTQDAVLGPAKGRRSVARVSASARPRDR